jgi:membrane protein YqaA with SNARE-associated domain
MPERPSAFSTLEIGAPPADGAPEIGQLSERCQVAKASFNSAHRGKVAYFWLFFVLAVLLVVAAGYALVAFDDDKQAAGWLALVAAVGALLGTGIFALLWRRAKKDEDDMWKRVEKYCE